MPKIAVIIPVHEKETAQKNLADFFADLNDPDLEIITSTGSSRANAMNKAASETKAKIFWFLHADSLIEENHIQTLKKSLTQYPDKIHYFDLQFAKDGPRLTILNTVGANIRSRVLGLPWGDQGFCLSNKIFQKLGGYDENTAYGEDHLFIWRAHKQRIALNRIPIPIISSAREYKKKGWIQLTLKRQYYWLKQAIPQFFKLIKGRLSS